MRVWSFLLVAALMPWAAADNVQVQLFEDESGDVEIRTQDGAVSQPDPTGFYANVDIVAAGVWAEDDAMVTFFIRADDLSEDSQVPLPFSDPDYEFNFRHGEQGYRVTAITALENPANSAIGREVGAFGFLSREVAPGRFANLASVEVELDFSEELVLMHVPRGALVDHNQAPLARNATLHDIYVESRSMGWFGFPLFFGGQDGTQVGIPEAGDRAPDVDEASYTIRTGSVQQKGSIFAVSPDPIRWTNGEATTLTFPVTVTNLGSQAIDLSVRVTGTGTQWEVAYSDTLQAPAGRSVNTTILATIPFNHQHGVTELFEVVFRSKDDAHHATAILGVHWPTVPQPAGHHDRLWLHSTTQQLPPPFDAAFGGVHGWFNAIETQEGDERVPLPAQFTTFPGFFGAQEGQASWFLQLEPALRLGLDLEPGRDGSMELGFELPVPAVDPYVEVEIYHQSRSESQGRGSTTTTRILSGQSEVQSGTVSGGVDFELPLLVDGTVDDIPYDPDANLGMRITLYATLIVGGGFANPESITPTIIPGSSVMQWPLNEYHDPADLQFKTDASVDIQVGGQGQERFVNPGRTVVYEFALTYSGDAPTAFTASLSGTNLPWGTIIGDPTFDLLPGQARPLAIAVTAPDDARDGDRADLTLKVTSVQNTAVQAGVGALTTVTTGEDIPDESDRSKELAGELTKDKDTPAAWSLPLLALVVALRRRQAK